MIDFQAIKDAASGRWGEILSQLTPLRPDVLKRGKQDHPCPSCNGASVIWPSKDAEQSGRIACRKCTNNKPTGDGIATVAQWGGMSQADAAKAVASLLGIDGRTDAAPTLDTIAAVCRDKRMAVEAFVKFGAKVEHRGRNKHPVARVPVYDERGEVSTYFDLAAGHKGWFARGGGVGLFLPGRPPKPGETWLLVEGVKDAAALTGLGFLAAGLPSSCMADKYARLFAECDVVLVPDLDTAGQSGAQQTGGRLKGIAASVKVARLPGEIFEKGGDDVRDVLARQGGEKLVRDAIEQAIEWTPREGEHKQDGRPEVLITLAYGWCCDQVIQHLGRLGWATPWVPPSKRERLKLYQRGGALVEVVDSSDGETLAGIDIPEGTKRIRPLPQGQLPLRIADACQLTQEAEEGGEVVKNAVPPQRWLIDGIFTRGDWGAAIRRLEGIILSPTMRPDGTVLESAGYDQATGLLYAPQTKFPEVGDNLTADDARRAADELLEVVRDFPFVDDADRSAWLALVLSHIGRSAIAGCVPLFGITATTRGSGKSLLADAASVIAYGRLAPRKTFSLDDNEQRKAITATAIEALPSVLLDNVDCLLGGASLDAALTATTWTDRILGSSKTTGELPLRTIWTATGNNLRFGTDLARRVLPIRLAPQVENPEERDDFEHANLLQWVREHRPRLAVAALRLLRAYVLAGRPEQTGGVWGSFEAWSSLVRGAIVWANLPDPLVTRETAKADDTSGAIVQGLIGGLLEVDDTGEGVTAREIVDLLNSNEDRDTFPTMRDVAAEVGTYKGKLDSRRLGVSLRKYRGRISSGWCISGEPNRNGVIQWTAQKVEISAGYAGYAGYKTSQSSHTHVVCVPHTRTRDTQQVRSGDGAKPHPASPAYPAVATPSGVMCPGCESDMQPSSEQVNGWRNYDCPNCGAVKPMKEIET